MSLPAMPGTARIVHVRFSLGLQLVQLAPAARQAVVGLWLQPFSSLWLVHCYLWWCSACLSVLAALPSLSTRVHTPGLRGVACPRLRSSCPRGTDQLGESTRVHTEMAWPVVSATSLSWWRPDPACRRGYIHRVSAAWFVHVCGARVRAARITWAGRPSFATRRRGCACCGRRFSRGSASSRRHRAVSPTVSVAAACPCAWLALGFWTIWRIGQFGVFGSAHRTYAVGGSTRRQSRSRRLVLNKPRVSF